MRFQIDPKADCSGVNCHDIECSLVDCDAEWTIIWGFKVWGEFEILGESVAVSYLLYECPSCGAVFASDAIPVGKDDVIKPSRAARPGAEIVVDGSADFRALVWCRAACPACDAEWSWVWFAGLHDYAHEGFVNECECGAVFSDFGSWRAS